MKPAQTLKDDTRGAMMVIAVFMAVFLVGCLWYLIGVGDAAIYGERMQDAADSVAYVGAVYHARGMNVLAAINLIMAGLIAVLIALKLLLLLIELGMIIAGVLCAIPWSAAVACPVEGVLSDIHSEVHDLVGDYENIVNSAIVPGLSVAQQAIAKAMPGIALAESMAYAKRFAPTVKGGAAASNALLSLTLPVEKLPFDAICAKSNAMLEGLVTSLLPAGFGTIAGGMVSALVSSYPSYFCGDSNSSGAQQQLDPKFCDKQEAKWKSDGKSWNDACDKLGYGSDCPNDLTAQGGPKKPGDFSKDDCEKSYKDEKKRNGKIDDGGRAQNTDTKSGQQVAHDAKLGGDAFAVFSAVLGDRDRMTKSDKGVGMASWGDHRTRENASAALVQHIALSRAEFYYDAPGSWGTNKDEALWNLKWRARLRRFRMPSATVFDAVRQIPELRDAIAAIDDSDVLATVKAVTGKDGDVKSTLESYGVSGNGIFIH